MERVRIVVAEGDAGLRLDQLLAARVPDLSRRKARVAIDIGGVFVDGARTKVAGRIVRAGQVVTATLGGTLDRATKAPGREARARDAARHPPHAIVHQDADVVVVLKPAGLLTAPTPEGDRGTLATLLAAELGREALVVHRLDLDTSGLLVFALTPEANRALSERFRVHDVERAYLAALAGEVATPAASEGSPVTRIEAPVGGRSARTDLEVVERLPGATLVRCTLHTGRTHQIRLHARGIGHPVLGDRTYGLAPAAGDPPRMALHAAVLGFAHPRSGEALRFEAPLPPDLDAWLARRRAGVG